MIVSVVFLCLAALMGLAWLTFDKWSTKWGGWLAKKKPISNEGRELNPKSTLDHENKGTFYLELSDGEDPVILSEKIRYEHIQALGSTGTGKTYNLIKPAFKQDIMRGAGVINFDVKSNMDEAMLGYAREFGRGHDFLRFQLKDPDNSLTYNPFVGENPIEVANRVWTAFFQSDKTQTGYYREEALSFCRAFFGQCHTLGVLPTLKQLLNCLMDQALMEQLANLAPETEDAHFIVQRYLQMTRKDYMALFSGFVNKVAPFTRGSLARLFDTTSPQIVMADVIKRSRLLYFGLASDIYPADYKIISTMALLDIQSSLTARYMTDEPGIFCYLDEFGELVFEGFPTFIQKSREAKIGLVLAHHSFGQLKAIGGDAFVDTILNLARNKVAFCIGDPNTAELLAKLSGTLTKKEELVNYSLVEGKKAKGMTEVMYEEFVIHPNALKTQRKGEAFLIVQRDESTRQLFHRKTMLKATPVKPDFAYPYSTKSFEPITIFKPLVFEKSKPISRTDRSNKMETDLGASGPKNKAKDPKKEKGSEPKKPKKPKDRDDDIEDVA